MRDQDRPSQVFSSRVGLMFDRKIKPTLGLGHVKWS